MKNYILNTITLIALNIFMIQAQVVWTQKSNHLGAARLAYAGFSINGKGYFGGGAYGGSFNAISEWQEFNPLLNSWNIITPMIYPFKGLTAFEIGGFGYVANGVNTAFYNYDTFKYNQAGNNWSTLSSLVYPRLYSTSTANGSKGFIIGGYGFSAEPLNDLWQYDPILDLWTEKDTLPLAAARYNATSFSIDGNVYVFGGTNNLDYLNDLWKYDTTSGHWTQMTSLPGIGRQLSLAVVLNNEAYIIGGNPISGPNLSEVWKYNANADSWFQLADFPGVNTPFDGAAFVINNKGYIVPGNGTTECWEIDPGFNSILLNSEAENLNIDVCPNPVVDKSTVLISGKIGSRYSIEILNSFGRIVYSQKTTNFEICLNKGDFANGVYFIRVQNEKLSAKMFKFIVQ